MNEIRLFLGSFFSKLCPPSGLQLWFLHLLTITNVLDIILSFFSHLVSASSCLPLSHSSSGHLKYLSVMFPLSAVPVSFPLSSLSLQPGDQRMRAVFLRCKYHLFPLLSGTLHLLLHLSLCASSFPCPSSPLFAAHFLFSGNLRIQSRVPHQCWMVTILYL